MSAINTIQLANGDEYDINDERISAVPIPITEGGTNGTTAPAAKHNLGLGTSDTSNFRASDFNSGTGQLWGIIYTTGANNPNLPSNTIDIVFKTNGILFYNDSTSTSMGTIPFIATGTADPGTAVSNPVNGMVYLKKRS